MLLRLKQAGIIPQKHILDNEVSTTMKTIIRNEYKMKLELVPPGYHRRNAEELAIRKFRAHFLSVLAGKATSFPSNLRDRLLPQAKVTINLLRQSNPIPNLSAYAHLGGTFDYNRHQSHQTSTDCIQEVKSGTCHNFRVCPPQQFRGWTRRRG